MKPSAWRPWSSIWAWSWDPLKFMRRHPPHHLSPARASYRTGPDPEARLSRPKSPQQRSVQARKPVISEQDSCSLALMSGLCRERYCTVSSNPTLSASIINYPIDNTWLSLNILLLVPQIGPQSHLNFVCG